MMARYDVLYYAVWALSVLSFILFVVALVVAGRELRKPDVGAVPPSEDSPHGS